jgi:integrase
MILLGMFSLAVRFDVLNVNPIAETKTMKTIRTPARAADEAEFEQIRAAVKTYVGRRRPGPHPGRLLPAFVEILMSTGVRPNEVLALRWQDVGSSPGTWCTTSSCDSS